MGDDLNERIAQAQEALDKRNRPATASTGRGMGIGMRMATDFVAAVLVGLVLGWGVDTVFHVAPWGLVTCLLFGFAAGVRNTVRTATQMSAEAGSGYGAGEVPEGPEETKDAGESGNPANDKDV